MTDEKISSGSFDFNTWLHGGYERGVITMIAGPPASGKTNFVLLAACSQAKKGHKVIFIDTEGGFSIERIKQIVGEGYKEVLENILLFNLTSFDEQKKLFLKLLERVKREDIGLMVVDGMAMLYRLEIGDALQLKDDYKIKNINREVAKQMRILAEISRKQQIPIIITNQVYHEFVSLEDWKKGISPEANLVGGDLLKYWSKTIIELKKLDSKRKAILLKHRSLPQKELSFEIRNEGVFKKGWI